MTDRNPPPPVAEDPDVPFLAAGIPWTRLGRFLRVLAIVFLLEGVILVGLTVVVNPRSEFPIDVFEPLIPNTHQIKIDIYGEYLENEGAPDAVVLGTSRARRLDPQAIEAVGYGRTFNFAIEAAEIEDELAVWRWMVAQGDAPERVLLFLDLDQLRIGGPVSLRLATNPDLKPYTDVSAGFLDYLQWAAFYASRPDYVVDTGTVLWYSLVGFPETRITYEANGALAEKGDLTEFFVNTTRGQQNLKPFLQEYWKDYLGHEAPAPEKARLFGQLIDEVLAEGATVDIVLAPIQPDYLDILRANTPFDRLHSATVQALLQRCGDIRLFDFTLPDTLGVNPDEFVDGVHYQGDNVGRIIAGLGDPELELCAN